jgi:hypothetical protein
MLILFRILSKFTFFFKDWLISKHFFLFRLDHRLKLLLPKNIIKKRQKVYLAFIEQYSNLFQSSKISGIN